MIISVGSLMFIPVTIHSPCLSLGRCVVFSSAMFLSSSMSSLSMVLPIICVLVCESIFPPSSAGCLAIRIRAMPCFAPSSVMASRFLFSMFSGSSITNRKDGAFFSSLAFQISSIWLLRAFCFSSGVRFSVFRVVIWFCFMVSAGFFGFLLL